MRINFNGETSSINSWANSDVKWLDYLQEEFCSSYDLDINKSTVIGYLGDPTAAQDMAVWLQHQGYRVSYYELSYKSRSDSNRTVSYGLDFDDTCLKFTELRLKCG
jgi:hypothetical protein